MEAFETTLTGSDGPIDGVVDHISSETYQFSSIDGSLQLTITKTDDGGWTRLAGSEPYLASWTNELGEHITVQNQAV